MSDPVASDEQLMTRYRDGDADAFEQLYRRHRGGLFRFILRQARDRGVAEELFQDVWMKVVAARSRYVPEGRFATWLYQIAHNRLIDHYRSRPAANRRVDLDIDDDAGPAARYAVADGVGIDPAERTQWRQSMNRVLDGIDNLPLAQREAFLMHQEGGLPLAAIAEATGVGIETARSRLRYAVSRLRELAGIGAPDRARRRTADLPAELPRPGHPADPPLNARPVLPAADPEAP